MISICVLAHFAEQYRHLTTIPPKGSFKDDISLLLPALPNEKTCASFAYRTDDRSGGPDQYGWFMITFVPDEAPVSSWHDAQCSSAGYRGADQSVCNRLSSVLQVRSKMLHASSKASLLKALGESRFKRTMFFTSPVSFPSHEHFLDPRTTSELNVLVSSYNFFSATCLPHPSPLTSLTWTHHHRYRNPSKRSLRSRRMRPTRRRIVWRPFSATRRRHHRETVVLPAPKALSRAPKSVSETLSASAREV